jgi:hypothetical protein
MVPKMTSETRAVVVQKPVQSESACLHVYLRENAQALASERARESLKTCVCSCKVCVLFKTIVVHVSLGSRAEHGAHRQQDC